MNPLQTLEAFDLWLASRALRLDAIVVGGAALVLLGAIDRQTRDVDILAPELSDDVTLASREFAEAMRSAGVDLSDDWLNNGPIQLADVLPTGWELRKRLVLDRGALRLWVLSRPDLLKTKLFALCDRATDLADCLALLPTAEELESAIPWLVVQDANPMWPAHVIDTIEHLGRRLGHGV